MKSGGSHGPRSRRAGHQTGTRSVYAELGDPAAADMLVKAGLVAKIAEILAERRCTQSEAAAMLGISQPKLSGLLRGQFRGFSERRLMDFLTRLGRDVQIVVRDAPKARSQGHITVRFA